MKTFYKLLGIALIVAATNNFVWFALTFWIFLGTKSVISTSTLATIWIVTSVLSSIWLGSLVDRFRKKQVMLGSSIVTLLFLVLGLVFYLVNPVNLFTSISSPSLWLFVLIVMFGVVAGSIYQIAMPTLVAIIVPEKKRDRANGMFGTVMGVAFAITSVASGLVLSFGGMVWVLGIAITNTIIAIILLSLIKVKEKYISVKPQNGEEDHNQGVDIKGTIRIIKSVPGLFALIFFTTINNFLGGVFMALLDAYGLSLVRVEIWGTLWGILSFGFIFGGLYIAKKGLGNNPLNKLFQINAIMWIVCIFFTIQHSVVLLGVGLLIWMFLVPFAEAIEQTIFQKVVPPKRLGRVFGFAHTVEQAASPLTAFFIGPIAQFIFIPFMTTGQGVDLIGNWFGVGLGRGIALVFIVAGIIGLLVTILFRNTRHYKLLAERYIS